MILGEKVKKLVNKNYREIRKAKIIGLILYIILYGFTVVSDLFLNNYLSKRFLAIESTIFVTCVAYGIIKSMMNDIEELSEKIEETEEV